MVDPDEVVDLKRAAVLGDPIVGVEAITYDDAHGKGALPARPLPSPREPSQAEIDRHNLTHLPFCSWCPICVACRRPNDHHRLVKDSPRQVPLLVGDYCFVRNMGDDSLVPVLVLKLYPFGLFFACVVSRKGYDDDVIKRVSSFVADAGLTHFCYRSDREPSILALMEAVCLATGRRGDNVTPEGAVVEEQEPGPEYVFDLSAADIPAVEKPPAINRQDLESAGQEVAVVGVPESSHPGESASNGKAESAVRSVVDMTRTLKVALEARLGLGKPIPCSHPVVSWLFLHATWVLNKYSINSEGRTPWGLLHGREARERIAEFGERILYYLPKKTRAKMDVRWRYGVFLGRSLSSDQNIIALSDGSTTRARAMVRVVPSNRWDAARIQGICATPLQEHKTVEALDSIEAEMSPHDHAPSEQPEGDADAVRARRRLKIQLSDIGQYGATKNCPKCLAYSQNKKALAHRLHHTEACRARFYAKMKDANAPKFLQAEKEAADRIRSRDSKAAKDLVQEEQQPAPVEPADASLDVPDGADQPAPLSAEEGIDAEDTSFLYGDSAPDDLVPEQDVDNDAVVPDDEQQAMDSEDHVADAGEMVDMVALMDTLQVLGVDIIKANRFVASLVKSKPSLMELYGRGSICKAANGSHRNLNVLGEDALDLRTCKPSGERWDFTKRSDRMEALQLVRDRRPTWVIGSPPCTSFSTIMNWNFRRMSEGQVRRCLEEGRLHLHFMLKIYEIQLAAGRHFLHEHPQGASSWRDPAMLRLLQHPRVETCVAHQCQFGLTTPDAQGQPQAAKKPTRFASSSPYMLRRLERKCQGGHRHEHLVGGKPAAAAFYPLALVEAILRGIRDTADAADQDFHAAVPSPLVHAVQKAGQIQDVQPGVSARLEAEDLKERTKHHRIPFRYADGHVVELNLQWKPSYKDEYTSDILPQEHIRHAMVDEMEYMCREVIEGVSLKEALADPDHVIVGGRWVTSNKQDTENPDCRGRYVAQEINRGGEADAAFYAATPPLEAKRLLFSMWARERERGGHPLKLHFLDVKKAFFNGVPRRSMYIRLPPEMGLGASPIFYPVHRVLKMETTDSCARKVVSIRDVLDASLRAPPSRSMMTMRML